MRVLDPARAREAAAGIFQACGVSAAHAELVATELVDAELMGISSHGLIRVMEYLREISAGRTVPDAEVRVVQQEGGCLVVDGGRGMGIVTAHAALSEGIRLARVTKIAAVVTQNCNHVNRLGSYAERAAAQGMICIAAAALAAPHHLVVPWGGADPRLGTNPIAYGFPTESAPIVADFATSVVPEGRVRVAQASGTQLPPGAIVDGTGSPTTDPDAFYGPPRGSLLPFGGEVGYKGYALGMLVELLGGVLAGGTVTSSERQVNGVFLLLVDPSGFLPAGRTEQLAQQAVDYMHSSAPARGFERVLVPGELEARNAAAHSVFEVSDTVWDQLCEAGRQLDVDVARAELVARGAEASVGD